MSSSLVTGIACMAFMAPLLPTPRMQVKPRARVMLSARLDGLISNSVMTKKGNAGGDRVPRIHLEDDALPLLEDLEDSCYLVSAEDHYHTAQYICWDMPLTSPDESCSLDEDLSDYYERPIFYCSAT